MKCETEIAPDRDTELSLRRPPLSQEQLEATSCVMRV